MRNEKPLYVRMELSEREAFDTLVGEACGAVKKKIHATAVFRAAVKFAMQHKTAFFSVLRKELDNRS